MHELSITCSIVDVVTEAARGRKVRNITVEIGELSGVVANSVAFWFPEVARGTVAEGAALQICDVAAMARCNLCGADFAAPSPLNGCPCGSFRFKYLRGEELNVKSIELEGAS
jgi:hydrogenase nickel incorporation protein HypA/HybF